MEKGGGTGLYVDLNSARSRLDKDDVVARRDLESLPDSRGKSDPTSGRTRA